MSVNEVKSKEAAIKVEPLVVKGTGPPTARTFCIGNEDHTLGNALRHVLIRNHAVQFAGYSVPHPSEPIVQIRIQTMNPNKSTEAPTATQALQTACQTLHAQCDIVLEKLEEILPEVKEDRLKVEKFQLEEGYRNDEDYDEDDDDEDQVNIKMEEE